ncbi:hypothetical protein [Haloquadratum walsbyi]|nr:hypothetical protein [Haloquadratum walsbyi]
MDEKTADLRDIFLETTGTETVTDKQDNDRGSLIDNNDATIEDRLQTIISQLRNQFADDLSVSDEILSQIARGFFDPELNPETQSDTQWSQAADAKLAASIADSDIDADTVFAARMSLHLVTDADREAPFDLDRLRSLLAEGKSTTACAETLETTPTTVDRLQRVIEAEAESRQVSHRFRASLADLLSDNALSERLATDARRDGLEPAIDDLETDVSL